MRKIIMMVAMVALMVPLGAGLAFAGDQIKQCTRNPCIGAGNNDLIYERVGNGKADTIILKGGNDKVLANGYTRDNDVVKGGSGFDRLNARDGDTRDRVGVGDGGRDFCIVDTRAEAGKGCARVQTR